MFPWRTAVADSKNVSVSVSACLPRCIDSRTIHAWKFDRGMNGAFPSNVIQLTRLIDQSFVWERLIVCMICVLASLKIYRRPKNLPLFVNQRSGLAIC